MENEIVVNVAKVFLEKCDHCLAIPTPDQAREAVLRHQRLMGVEN